MVSIAVKLLPDLRRGLGILFDPKNIRLARHPALQTLRYTKGKHEHQLSWGYYNTACGIAQGEYSTMVPPARVDLTE
jgi:hypothetical protein